MSELGLVEMTRKRLRKEIDSFLREPCSCCEGEGKVLSLETIAVNFLRKLEEICGNTSSPTLAFSVGEELGVYLQGEGQKFLDNLEKLYGKEILWKVDSSSSSPSV
jgi:ribonuclease G